MSLSNRESCFFVCVSCGASHGWRVHGVSAVVVGNGANGLVGVFKRNMLFSSYWEKVTQCCVEMYLSLLCLCHTASVANSTYLNTFLNTLTRISFTISIEDMCFHCLLSFTVCDLIPSPPLSYVEISMELIHSVGYRICNRSLWVSLVSHDALPNTTLLPNTRSPG